MIVSVWLRSRILQHQGKFHSAIAEEPEIVFAAMLSVFAAAPAFAENGSGFYAGAKLGQSDVGGAAFGFGVYGGYVIDSLVSGLKSRSEFTQKLSFAGEVEYASLGSNSTWGPSATYATYKASAFGVVLDATYPVNRQFSVIAKAGVANTSYEYSCGGCSWGWNNSTFDLRVGVAGEYNLTEQIGLRAGIDSYPDGFNQISAGAVFKF